MRGGIKRTRTGCARCKERKLKCDETRPGCIRCRKRNTPCPGYYNTAPDIGSLPDEDFNSSLDRRDSAGTHQSVSSDLLSDSYRHARPSPQLSSMGLDAHDPDLLSLTDQDLLLYQNFQYNLGIPWMAIGSGSEPAPTTTASSVVLHHSLLTSPRPPVSAPPRSGWSSKALAKTSEKEDSQVRKAKQAQAPKVPTMVLNDHSSTLVEFYFKEVAGLFSCYDSQLNPFRSTVSKLWQSSSPVYYVVQSMAAACLSDVFPQLHATGAEMRDKAAASVEADITESNVDTGSLLTLIMLGLSASWHHASDLGQKEFKHARTIMDDIHTGKTPSGLENNSTRNLQFFQEAMIYWEMLLSYVSDVTFTISMPPLPPPEHQPAPGPGLPSRFEASETLEPSFPHPWTGVAREAQAIVFEVGRLVRQERHRIRNRPLFTSLADIDTGRKALDTAQMLADRLRNLRLPTEEAIVSPGDAQTPVKHLLTIAESYRLTGLLQLYRVFPDLLTTGRNHQDEDDEEQVSHYGLSAWKLSEEMIHKVLTDLALEIVDLLKTIPTESRTRCVQPFLLVASGGELRTVPSSSATNVSRGQEVEDLPSDTARAIRVFEARKFIIGRLSTFEHVLPAKPIRQMMEIVKHTWDQMDMGLVNVYWMDVMIEKGWETTMG